MDTNYVFSSEHCNIFWNFRNLYSINECVDVIVSFAHLLQAKCATVVASEVREKNQNQNHNMQKIINEMREPSKGEMRIYFKWDAKVAGK